MDNKKTLRYIAGACFAIWAVLEIVSLVEDGFYVWSLLSLIGAVLIAVSMFSSISVLTTVGSALYLVDAVRTLIFYIGLMQDGYSWLPKRLLFLVMYIAIWVLLIIAGINTKSAKNMGIIAGVIDVVRFIAIIIDDLADGGFSNFSLDFLLFLVLSAGLLLIGLSSEDSDIKKVISSSSSEKAQIQQGTEITIERLTKLKALLDNGVITQEEFESKKKQIMGM